MLSKINKDIKVSINDVKIKINHLFITLKFEFLFISVLSLAVIFSTINLYMINTADFLRVIDSFMPQIPEFQEDISLKYKMYDEFAGIGSYSYKSTYSYLLYCFARITKIFTSYFDARILAAILKMTYIFSLFILYKLIVKRNFKLYDYIAFAILVIYMCSSSNISYFTSFYQEQIFFLFLPIMACCLVNKENNLLYTTIFVASAFIIGGCKSQFFYIPISCIFFCIYFVNYRKTLLVSLVIAQILCVIFVINSSQTVNYNKYHAAYFGIYAYEAINGFNLPYNVDKKCIGIDAWGVKISDKVVDENFYNSGLAKTCYSNNKNINFLDLIKEYIKHPSIIFKLPFFDDIVKNNYVTDYYHVFKTTKLIVDKKNSWATKITLLKDKIFSSYRFHLLLFFMSLFSLFKPFRAFCYPVVFIGLLGITQFYISFLGEGYRDLCKHISGLAFSFDIIVFLLISFLIGNIKNLNFLRY